MATWQTVVALWGAILSTLLAVVKGWELRNDRARILIRAKLTYASDPNLGKYPRLDVLVTNLGRRVAHVMEVGIRFRTEGADGPPGLELVSSQMTFEEGKFSLGEGEPRTFVIKLSPENLDRLSDPGEVFATLSDGKRVIGNFKPISRIEWEDFLSQTKASESEIIRSKMWPAAE